MSLFVQDALFKGSRQNLRARAWAHVGPRPCGHRPKWAQAHVDTGLNVPGPMWAQAQMTPILQGCALIESNRIFLVTFKSNRI